uniref:Uncharacterized protein n=1 Tax=Anguilla anguilla TaxID=7936 RepID=A0A0E9WKR3_ANGAN
MFFLFYFLNLCQEKSHILNMYSRFINGVNIKVRVRKTIIQ